MNVKINNKDALDNVRVRFAPSPTGYLHIGGARTALFNWLFARHHNGKFILRIEDTDETRLREDYIDCILDGLEWLTIDWDEGPRKGGDYGPYRQSEKKEVYQKTALELIEQGYAYLCYCTPEELEERRQDMLKRGIPPMYDGRCRGLTNAQRSVFESQGRKASIRFKMADKDIVVNDVIRGQTLFKKETQGDFVILKSDGTPTYQLANVIDDAFMEVSHVIRGEDLLPSTARQIAIYEALGKKVPVFAHLPMILAPDRSKLSKRHGAVAVTDYREKGYLPEAILNYLALLGWSPPDGVELMDRDKMIAQFSLERINKAGAIFDLNKLNFINAQKIKNLSVSQLKNLAHPFFESVEMTKDDETFEKLLLLTRDSVSLFSDFPERCRIILSEPEFSCDTLKNLLSLENSLKVLESFINLAQEKAILNESELHIIFKDVQKETGTKGKDLYLPVRIAITGEMHGPDMVGLISVIGKKPALDRIRAFKKFLEENMNKT